MNEFQLPDPLNKEQFQILRHGISDGKEIDVHINSERDFAFLYPFPEIDYQNYTPRVKKNNLQNYHIIKEKYEKRFDKIKDFFKDEPKALVEIGCGSGTFLKLLKIRFPLVNLTGVEKDKNSLEERLKIAESVESIESLEGRTFDLICLFHVFEHITDQIGFLHNLSKLMHEKSMLIIEVPCLFDPLLSVYKCEKFSNYYFQRQHPFIYTPPSLTRLLEENGYSTQSIIPYQRYGMENHLNWLCNGNPGGNELFQRMFGEMDAKYKEVFEKEGTTDTFFWVGKRKR